MMFSRCWPNRNLALHSASYTRASWMLLRLVAEKTKRTLRRAGFDVVRYRNSDINRLRRAFGSLLDVRGIDESKYQQCAQLLTFCACNLWRSKAQLFQDLFV